MTILGAHMSIAGGYYKAADAARQLGMNCVQLFTKNNNQWAAKPISNTEADAFRTSRVEGNLSAACSHVSYLINVASPNDELWDKSLAALVHEVERASQLGLDGIVMHPGSFTTSDTEAGLQQIAKALKAVLKATSKLNVGIWLETTAGQGSNLGAKFEEIGDLITRLKGHDRIGVCVDTCHIFAAGYAIGTPAEYAATFATFDTAIGIDRVKAFHVNDSAKPFGSRVDRHAHIGHGEMGLEPFRLLLNDPRWATTPMYLETEKGEQDGEEWDAINLRVLRGLVGTPALKSKPASKRKVALKDQRTE